MDKEVRYQRWPKNHEQGIWGGLPCTRWLLRSHGDQTTIKLQVPNLPTWWLFLSRNCGRIQGCLENTFQIWVCSWIGSVKTTQYALFQRVRCLQLSRSQRRRTNLTRRIQENHPEQRLLCFWEGSLINSRKDGQDQRRKSLLCWSKLSKFPPENEYS